MKAKGFRLQRGYKGEWELTAILDDEAVPEAMRLVDEAKGIYDLRAKPWKDKRSLTANAYFHTLCNKLAAKMRISNDACKVLMVKSYGTVAERNGSPVMIVLPKGANPDDYYPYCEWIDGDATSDTYQLYKQTHTLDSVEFARLVDGVVDECKLVGIETLPPAELARLYAQTDKANEDTGGGEASRLRA